MQSLFSEYYTIESKAEQALWEKSIFAFDANVLLNFYRYSPETVSLLEETLKSYVDKIWIPYNVGIEFYNNRLDVINSQIKNYNDNLKSFRNLLDQFSSFRGHPFISTSLLQELKNLNEKLNAEFSQSKKYLSSLRDKKDDILTIVESLFNDKVGEPFSIDELTKIYDEGEKRFSNLTPPGFLDYKKDGKRKYGDYVIWKQLINKSIKNKCSVIFISDDQKEDWVATQDGKKYFPHPDLVREFKERTGYEYYSYSTSEFLKSSSKFSNTQFNNEAFEEILSISKSINEEVRYYESTYKVEFTLHVELNRWNIINELQKALSGRGYILFTKEKTDSKIVFIVELVFEDLIRRFKYLLLRELEKYDRQLVYLDSFVVSSTDK